MKLQLAYILVLLLGGCAQDSNPLLFGTSTSLGVAMNAGSGTDISPSLTVGYGREEVAIVPTIVPEGIEADNDRRVISAAVYEDERIDALSTFADFNNENTSGTSNILGIGIGSTFATGVAAQYVSLGYVCEVGELEGDDCRQAIVRAAEAATETPPPAGR